MWLSLAFADHLDFMQMVKYTRHTSGACRVSQELETRPALSQAFLFLGLRLNLARAGFGGELPRGWAVTAMEM